MHQTRNTETDWDSHFQPLEGDEQFLKSFAKKITGTCSDSLQVLDMIERKGKIGIKQCNPIFLKYLLLLALTLVF